MEPLLRLAIERLSAGDPSFYEPLRDAWRACRSAELAELIERAGILVEWTSAAPPPRSMTPKAWQAAWVARAREANPLALGNLFAALLAQVGKTALVVACLDELANACVDDPQVTRPLLALLDRVMRSPQWNKVHTRVFQGLEAANDPRAIEGLGPAVERSAAGDHSAISIGESLKRAKRTRSNIIAGFHGGVPPLPPELAGIVAELRAKLDDPPPIGALRREVDRTQVLLEAVWADPRDDGRRLVCADALQAAGDPRGELIAAQMSDAPDAARRAKTLIAKHRHTLLGPLAKAVVASTAVFDKGFLASCDAGVVKLLEVDAMFGRPEWATVERLRFTGHGALTPAMRGLVEARDVPATGLSCLKTAAFPHLELLGIAEPTSWRDGLCDGQPTIAGLRALASATGLPRLRELHVGLNGREYRPSGAWAVRDASDFAWLLDAPFGAQLETLGIKIDNGEVIGSWLNVLRKHGKLRTIVARHVAAHVVLTKDGERIAAELRMAATEGAAIAALRAQLRKALGPIPLTG